MTDEEIQIKEFNSKWDIHHTIQQALESAHTNPSPKTLEMLNNNQKEMSDIKQILAVQAEKHSQIESTLHEIKEIMIDTNEKVNKVDEKVGFQNGRVRKLEDWSINAQKIIDSVSVIDKSVTTIDKDVSVSKARIWTAIGVFLLLGGVIITLGTMAIDNKIDKGIKEALLAKSKS
jgi:hypothetical protein